MQPEGSTPPKPPTTLPRLGPLINDYATLVTQANYDAIHWNKLKASFHVVMRLVDELSGIASTDANFDVDWNAPTRVTKLLALQGMLKNHVQSMLNVGQTVRQHIESTHTAHLQLRDNIGPWTKGSINNYLSWPAPSADPHVPAQYVDMDMANPALGAIPLRQENPNPTTRIQLNV